jgi:hypothetical protein
VKTRVLFLHGLEGSPQGHKPTHLRARGDLDVDAPAVDTSALRAFLFEHGGFPRGLPADLLEPLVEVVRTSLASQRPDVLVGSSFGGGLAMEIARRGLFDGPLVLLAPAGDKLYGIDRLTHPARVAIVHGRRDELVPVDDSVQLAARSDGEVALFLVEDEHRLRATVDAGGLDEALAWALGRAPVHEDAGPGVG